MPRSTSLDPSPRTASSGRAIIAFACAIAGLLLLGASAASASIVTWSGQPINADAPLRGLAAEGELHPTTTMLVCAPDELEVGGASDCEVFVEDIDAEPSAPTGTVSFSSDHAGNFSEGGSCQLSETEEGEFFCQVTYRPTEVGVHSVVATYSGDEGHEGSQGADEVVVGATTTDTEVGCFPELIDQDGTSHCTIAVQDLAPEGATIPSGEVEFSTDSDGIFSAQTCELVPVTDNWAICEVEFQAHERVAHLITAAYLGDAIHAPSSGTATVTVKTAEEENGPAHPTTAALACDPTLLNLGGASDCTATVTDTAAEGATSPAGEVSFSSDAAGTFSAATCVLAPAGADSSSCDITYSAEARGDHNLKASFAGDEAHEAAEATATVTVKTAEEEQPPAHPTATSVSCDPALIDQDASSTCTVTVTDTAAEGATVPAGEVQFTTDGDGVFTAPSCTLAPSAVDSATCAVDVSAHARAAQTITAAYAGAEAHEASEGTAAITVKTAEEEGGGEEGEDPHPTTADLSCDPALLNLNASSDCTVTVTDTAAEGATSPAGEVSFTTDAAGTFAAATCLLAPAGADSSSCDVAYSAEARGDHNLKAAYAGTEAHEPAEATDAVTVKTQAEEGGEEPEVAPTVTTLACAPQPVILTVGPLATTCTVTVGDAAAKAAAPAGRVSFASDGPGTFSPATCDLAPTAAGQSCQVTYAPSAVGDGSHRITAVFGATATHAASTAGTDVAVRQPPNTFVKKHPRKRTVQKVGRFTFIADQSPVSFECKLDKRAWRACKSPFDTRTLTKRAIGKGKRKHVRFIFKLRKGPHVLQVRAIDAQGLADPTPAVFRWRVGPPTHHPAKQHKRS